MNGLPKSTKERLARVEDLLARIDESADPIVREAAREVISILLDMHCSGLSQLVAMIGNSSGLGGRLLEQARNAPAVAGILAMHGLQSRPIDREKRSGGMRQMNERSATSASILDRLRHVPGRLDAVDPSLRGIPPS